MANPIDWDIDELGLLGYQTNQVEADPITEEAVEGDNADGNVESEAIYVGRVFNHEDEAYDVYNSYVLVKGFGVRKDRTAKSRIDGKILRAQFVCNKEGHEVW